METSNVENSKTAENEFVITRTFNAPRDLVYKAWTEADRLVKWWGPKGFTMGVAKLDLRPGGTFHYSMEAPKGGVMSGKMWGKFVYRDVVPGERLEFVVSFSDENLGTVRHPGSATWPLEVLNIVTFTEQNGKTLVTLRGWPIHATAEEVETFQKGTAGMRAGFGGTFEQLDAYLGSL